MKRLLYIGQYTEGSTSKMRGQILKQLLPDWEHNIIDTNEIYLNQRRLLKSLAFRYKVGPVVRQINNFVRQKAGKKPFDLIWVDKGIFISRKTMQLLTELCQTRVHFTPDPAFLYHKSYQFKRAFPFYTHFISTKSFEANLYREKLKPNQRFTLVTQGYDKELHRIKKPFSERKKAVVFIGHNEKERQQVVSTLLSNKIPVTVAGENWEKFIPTPDKSLYTYLGKGVFGEAYVDALNAYQFALGSVSKWIPEKHTTRNFEIPACGTVMLCEPTEDLKKYFSADEVLFYHGIDDLVEKVKNLMEYPEISARIAMAGHNRVSNDGRDYHSILNQVLAKLDR